MKTKEFSLEEFAQRARALKAARLFCAVDVGATNCRVAIVESLDAQRAVEFTKARASSRDALVAVLAKVAAAVGAEVCRRVAAAAVAVPGPVQDGVARISNYGKGGEDVGLRDLPAPLFPAGRTVLLNDLEAAATGLVGLNAVGAFAAHFTPMWYGSIDKAKLKDAGGGAAPPLTLPSRHTLVVAPGTGLGVGMLIWDPRAGRFVVLPLEFGHTNIATTEEGAFLKKYAAAMARGDFLPEYDDLCSGRGLQALYADESNENAAAVDAGTIVGRAKAGEPAAKRALMRYFRFLMQFAAQHIMGLQTNTVVLCGDNMVHNGFFFEGDGVLAALEKELHRHSAERMGFIGRATVARQTVTLNLNLVGCVQAALTVVVPTAKL